MTSKLPWTRNINEALLAAVILEDFKLTKKLLQEGANDTNSPLKVAATVGSLDMVKLLLDYGANVNTNDNTPLIKAVEHKHLDIVKLLLQKGADIHARNDIALRIAITNWAMS